MLSIVDHAFAVSFEIRDGLPDDSKIIFKCGKQYFLDMQSPRFAEDRADRCMRVDQCFDVSVIFGSAFYTACGTERSDEGIIPLHITGTLEEFDIFRIGARPSALDESDPQFIEFLCDADFV